MTLSYQSVALQPPSKAGLLTFGILLLIPSGLCLLFVPLMAVLGGVGGLANGSSAQSLILLGVAGIYFLIGGLFAWLAIDMIRARRWVRPVVVTLAGWLWITMLSTLPVTVLSSLGVAGPSGLASTAMVISSLFMFVFAVVIPFVYWNYFRTQKVKETWDPLESTCRHASLSIL